jgi:hypothetical protein
VGVALATAVAAGLVVTWDKILRLSTSADANGTTSS